MTSLSRAQGSGGLTQFLDNLSICDLWSSLTLSGRVGEIIARQNPQETHFRRPSASRQDLEQRNDQYTPRQADPTVPQPTLEALGKQSTIGHAAKERYPEQLQSIGLKNKPGSFFLNTPV